MEDHRWATGDEGKERAGEGGERKRQETAAASGDRQSLSDARRFRSGIVAAPEEITGGAQGEAPQRRRREMTAASGGPQSLSDVSRFRLGCHRWAAGNEGREIQGEAKKERGREAKLISIARGGWRRSTLRRGCGQGWAALPRSSPHSSCGLKWSQQSGSGAPCASGGQGWVAYFRQPTFQLWLPKLQRSGSIRAPLALSRALGGGGACASGAPSGLWVPGRFPDRSPPENEACALLLGGLGREQGAAPARTISFMIPWSLSVVVAVSTVFVFMFMSDLAPSWPPVPPKANV